MSETALLIYELSVIIIAAAFLSLVARMFKQPLIIAYIIAGIIIGPKFLGLITNLDVIKLFAELGIAFLLFIVGLELDLSKLKKAGSVAITTGIIQVLITFSIGFYTAFLLNFDPLSSIYIGLILSFSSTAIVVKLLGDKNELDTLHGRIILGILLIQDIIVVLALSVLTTLGNFSMEVFISSIVKGLGLVTLAIVFSQLIFPHILKFIEKTPELLFLTSTSILFLFIALSSTLGFSTAVGGFIAGLSQSTFPYNLEIISRAKSLRDFFVIIFFVSLGMMMDFSNIHSRIIEAFIFLLIVIALKPAIITFVCNLFNYSGRISLLTGISLAQISEFSLIVAMIGIEYGQINKEVFSLSTFLMMITAIITTYLIKYDRKVSEKLSLIFYGDKRLRGIEKELENIPSVLKDHIIILGAHEKGRKILEYFRDNKYKVIAVDYDPDVIKRLKGRGYYCIYGDAGNPEILERLNVKKAKMVISTIPDHDDNKLIVEYIKKENPDVVVFTNAESLEDALELYDLGSDYVLYNKMVSGEVLLSTVLNALKGKDSLERIKLKNIRELEHREEEDLIEEYGPEFLKSLRRRIYEGYKKRS